jgi:hypothetical protein
VPGSRVKTDFVWFGLGKCTAMGYYWFQPFFLLKRQSLFLVLGPVLAPDAWHFSV